MSRFFAIVAMILAAMFAVRWAASAPPSRVAAVARRLAGVALIVLGGFLSLRGLWAIGGPLVLFGLGMVSGMKAGAGGRGSGKPSGGASEVRTRLLRMRLDHASGRMEGEVVSGRFRGRLLDGLSDEELEALRGECAAAGDESLRLLETWLRRERPDWRPGGAGQGGGAVDDGPMTARRAREILGVDENASEEEVRAAHRRLMKAAHPDHGGSDWLARQLNEARDVLLAGKR